AFAACGAGAADAGEAGVEVHRQAAAVEGVGAAAQRDTAGKHDHAAVEVVDAGRAARRLVAPIDRNAAGRVDPLDAQRTFVGVGYRRTAGGEAQVRSEEHTSELQ